MMKCVFLITTLLFLLSCKKDAANVTVRAGVQNLEEVKNITEPALIHNVYFWAKEGTTAERLKKLERELAELGKINSIQNYYWGPSAPTEERDVVDHSYDYSISIHFASLEDHNNYQTDSIHLKFIQDCQDIWGKVVVYDNLVK